MKFGDDTRAVLDALPAPLAVIDREGVIVLVNAPWRSFAHDNRLADPSCGIGTNYVAMTRAAAGIDRFAEAAARGLDDVLAGRRPAFALEYPCHGPARERWFAMRVAPFGTPPAGGAVVTHANITDRRATERSLLESEQRLRAMFEMSMDAIVLENDDAIIVDANPAAAALTGRSVHELVGSPGWTLLGGETAQYWELRRQVLEQGELRGEIALASRGGTVDAEFAARARVLPGLHMATIRDITRRKQLEQQLLQSRKMETVGRLAGGVAHDFNNLLTAILGYADLLVEQHEDGDSRKQDAMEIRTAALRAAMLTRQLLTFSRHETARPQHVDLNAVITGLQHLLTRMAGEDMILTMDLAPQLPPVLADLGQMEQVAANLTLNARDAMDGRGEVTFTTRAASLRESMHAAAGEAGPGDYVELAVADRGHGISAPVLPHIFEPFFTTKDQGKGTGLGLSAVYGIVTGSGGHIIVETAPGSGTVFRVRLPAAAPAAPSAGASLPATGSSS